MSEGWTEVGMHWQRETERLTRENAKFVDIATRAQRLANERGGDYSDLTLDELCGFMVEYDEALEAVPPSTQEKDV